MTAPADDLAETVAPLARVRAMAPSLPPSDRRAAEVIAEWGDDMLARSITEVAQAANVAESTVIRACKRLGFTGFQGLKLAPAPAAENGRAAGLAFNLQNTQEAAP